MVYLSSFLWHHLLLATTATASPRYGHHHKNAHKHQRATNGATIQESICLPIPTAFYHQDDVVAKIKPTEGVCRLDEHVTPKARAPATSPNIGFEPSGLSARQADDPYSCNENKPCSNGACCAKSGYCGFGEKSCGTNGQSPNDVCWSNCDAHAECGRNSDPPNKECPLNVCCSQFGFCGMTDEFCKVTDDEETSCQSNCEQPNSGASGGNVQKRIIGYYEAWNYQKNCIGMRMQDIPVGSLTHIYYSFGYIRPSTYDIIPMDDGKPLSTDTFTEFASLKQKNPALKVVIALGGWTFNDNNTIWQPVFSDLSSTPTKRALFIEKLLTFFNRYGFDGVDLDWEYPGAPDRGGNPNDGENLTKLMKEMRAEFDKSGGSHKEISFTAPTSYWYMRHFDIKASSEAADFVNVMAYDLHGVWDGENPIGAQVLAHTNLTEIGKALDLLWRNGVDPEKINMGLGFYGRSFQLANPACSQPGCPFKGGASPGICTENSGTLSYSEIMDIIKDNDLTPYYDKEHGVKYITWGGDQWVSYDDFETFQQKIEYFNALGLGGILIWAIDLDTKQLDALEAVIYPEQLGARAEEATTADNWQDAGEGQCRVTECGVGDCKLGEVAVTQTQCEDEDFWDGSFRISTLCCPLASAPKAEDCEWRGGEPWCNGQCHSGEVALQSSLYGDWGKCIDGRKFYCCKAEALMPDCGWTDCGGSCPDTHNEMTWAYDTCSKNKKRKLCCNKEEGWKNCAWHGKPGNCFDNHCDTGWQVAITTLYEGEGEDCGFWHSDRQRTYCCDPPDGKSPFLPVPLDFLFSNPPPEAEADTEFNLKTDPTYGGSNTVPFAEQPDNAPFGFVVLTSPDTLQVSLDKRDGSHWEVFDCFDSVSEGEHTVRMMCTDRSESSNCDKIYLGHGAPGTIVEMPSGCGPGKYAVVKTLELSKDQGLPHHLVKRGMTVVDPIYDLTFDYQFKRVPRDLGNTQMRIDFSNEPEYWNNIVNKTASSKRRKRSLEEVGGSHKRWLEEEWRDDAHFGGLSKEELHKRWFGSDIIDWLKGIINGVSGGIDLSHTYSDDFILKIIDQRLTCPNVAAKLEVKAECHVDVDVNYGFTLVATLGNPGTLIDLSDSFLYFRTKGEVDATFVIDAAVTAMFDTGDIMMFSADKFGAAFAVPGIVTIGPNFKLFGRLEGQATLGVNFESKVKLAEWDIRQTYPVANDEWDPEASKTPEKKGTQNVLEPEFDYGLTLEGHLTAHVKPTITFGIDFNKDFIPIDSCAVNLVADGHVTFHAELKVNSESSFCYGVDAGADLYATIDAPSEFSWALPKSPFPIVPIDDVQLYPTGDQPACIDLSRKRDSGHSRNTTSELAKRAKVYGPLVPRLEGLNCPGAIDVGDIPPCPLCGDDDGESLEKRADSCWLDPYGKGVSCSADLPNKRDIQVDGIVGNETELHHLEKRDTKYVKWAGQYLPCGPYKSCTAASKLSGVNKWFGFRSGTGPCPVTIEKLNRDQTDTSQYVTEHIYEVQLLPTFFEWLITGPLPGGYIAPTRAWVDYVLIGMDPNIIAPHLAPGWVEQSLFFEMTHGLGGDKNLGGLALADKGMNGRKEHLFAGNTISSDNENNNLNTRKMHRNTAAVFSYMRNTWIWPKFVESSQFMEEMLHEFDTSFNWNGNGAVNNGQLGRPQRGVGDPMAGLRDLYCYWIDKHLTEIEGTAAVWLQAAEAKYRASSFGSDNAGIQWLQNVMTPQGPISARNLVFLHSNQVPHRFNPGNPNPVRWLLSNFQDLWRTGAGYGAAGPF
ncbi:glycoside hydrolase family 18 protein [Bipolaris sorokiniana ND90Pr]|uniref:chitinase n=1 Tax=Cochliobolus sativus (strain ND90Pr / ATCC 201652) TaxID=665912 RepID=M2T266_COCSN|nr:glycoside hydrolase family 18 protein [Bipolaris sorokiniana ND90Pr]EMD68575.1 glycoside hydrolase family 18 protein [Bipolaris sorokiniana ND90Pr]